jgi:uncharacterized membrane protein
MGITGWRQIRQSQHLPVPAALLAVTGLFVVLGLVADTIPAASRVVTLTAWGLDIAGLLRVLPAGLFTEVQQAQTTAAQATEPGTAEPVQAV